MTSTLFLLITDLLAYLMLFVICSVCTLNNSNSLQDILCGEGYLVQINLKHFTSILIILVLFFWHLNHNDQVSGTLKILPGYDQWMFPALALGILFISLHSKVPCLNEKLNQFSNTQVIFYFLLRVIYLVLYEIYFRGLLLNSLSGSFGITMAVIISSTLYFIIHVFNRRVEFLLSLPFGIVLSWLTIETLSIYPAIILHLLLSVPFEIRSFHHINKPQNGKDLLNWSNRLHW